MKILFVWSGLNGYMGDCWRELSKRNGVDLKVVIDTKSKYYGGGFNVDEVMQGIDWLASLPRNWNPDVVFSVGWHNSICRDAALYDWGAATKRICCFDMPWEWRLRKIAAKFLLRSYLGRFDAAFVPGAVAAKYARWLGFPKTKIYEGLFATDVKRFGRHVGGSGFLYVGRNASEKGIDILRSAHEIYNASGGRLPLKIVNGVSPSELGAIYANADCFVLASRWEPWGVVLVEAAAAGLPIICTDKCGAMHEVVKGNGLVVKANDANALSEAMLKVERNEAGIDGALGRGFAKSYSCQAWSDRVLTICRELHNV